MDKLGGRGGEDCLGGGEGGDCLGGGGDCLGRENPRETSEQESAIVEKMRETKESLSSKRSNRAH